MSLKDSAIVLCRRTDVLVMEHPELDPARPSRDHCAGCGTDVWVSAQTLERVGQERPGAPVIICCDDCGADMLNHVNDRGDEWDWSLTPEQGVLAPFLLQPKRTKQRRRRG